MNSIIYNLQFGFRQNIQHLMLSSILTYKIREQLDNGNFACGIFVDLQNVFDTIDHDIRIDKLNHYEIRGVANNWLSSNVQNRLQYVNRNCFNSNCNIFIVVKRLG